MKRLFYVVPFALLLTACGGGDDGGLPESTTPADLPALASQVEAELGVECDGEVITDMAGFDKVVCTLPEGHESGDGMGMALQSWSDRAAMEEWRDTWAGDSGFAAGDGWFVNAPSQEVADEVAAVLGG